ncbi:hypothetical protein AQJ66_09325 [Streptomyces bungoensis]|uniref:Uncharacterized protein n=1 Tax=Streptomyces bungoensis TaxID=285568 RepID=A0A101T8H3_9ACTN|nr:hypothetical protein [Streptomyces bungoensis]KUN87813.1 hypothetical protein AQJ66_09325 [Streptomyces bungoensis]
MPQHVSTLQLIGAAALTVAGVVWAVVVTRLLRRARVEAAGRYAAATLAALPPQRQAGPARESVELTSAERDAFAGLVRLLRDR